MSLAKEIAGQVAGQVARTIFSEQELQMARKGLRVYKKGKDYVVRKKRQSYKAKARMQTGETPGTDLSKTTQFRTDGATAYGTNILQSQNAIEIYRQSGSFALGTRLRDIVYLGGIKLCMNINNILVGGAATPLYVNVALVSGKNRGQIDNTDFFRCYNGTARQMDFTDATLSAYDRHCLPINTDELVVHFHDRKLLTFDTSTASGPHQVGKRWTIEKFIPIKRQIRFEGDSSTSETPFKLVWWCGKEGATIAQSTAATSTGNAMTAEIRMVYYFKEPMPVVKFR